MLEPSRPVFFRPVLYQPETSLSRVARPGLARPMKKRSNAALKGDYPWSGLLSWLARTP